MKNYHEALSKVQEIESKLSAYDFVGDQIVHVMEEHCEGQILIRNAFVLDYDNWWLVFAEHHKPMAFCKDEVLWVATYKIMPDDPISVDKFKPKKRKK